MIYYLYKIINNNSNSTYYGITNNTKNRWRSHKYSCNKGIKTPLYDAMRSYGFDAFTMETVACFLDKESACLAEIESIDDNRKSSIRCYNLHDGGTIGYSMKENPRYDDWKNKLVEKRAGRKPALGMKHSDENKKYFKEVSDKYWKTQNTYPVDIIATLTFKEASEQYGISRTHYYRLRVRFGSYDSR